jgi:hypothetical protein
MTSKKGAKDVIDFLSSSDEDDELTAVTRESADATATTESQY